MKLLASAAHRTDTTYRIIITENPARDPGFFPAFDRMTWQYSRVKGWQMTYRGNRIVSNTDSFIKGAGLDILSARRYGFVYDPSLSCHFNLPKNPEIMQRVMEYLENPGTPAHHDMSGTG